jgi:hypothetical protein
MKSDHRNGEPLGQGFQYRLQKNQAYQWAMPTGLAKPTARTF